MNRRLKSIKSFQKIGRRFPVWTFNPANNEWELRQYRYRLIFVETTSCDRQFTTNDNYRKNEKSITKYVWYTNKLILAMPRRSIELISWIRWQEIREDLIKSVVIQPSNKLLLGYSQPWWRNQGILAGRSITDLPLRMTYYFGTEGEQEGGDPKNLNSAIVASYSDMINVQFWKGLEKGTAYVPKQNKYWKKEDYEHWRGTNDEQPILAATQQMVQMAHSMLEEMHGFYPGSLPLPYVAMYKDWSGNPYGGGYHSWKAGYDYFDVIKKIRHPFPNGPNEEGEDVFITGSAYSNNQAWVEGAFQVAERVLQENFGLPQPDFVKPAENEAQRVTLYGP